MPQAGLAASMSMVSAVPQTRVSAARRVIAVPQARPAVITVCARHLKEFAVVVIISVEAVRYAVLMVRVVEVDRVHVVTTQSVQVGINVVIIIVVQQVKDVALMVRAELVKDVV